MNVNPCLLNFGPLIVGYLAKARKLYPDSPDVQARWVQMMVREAKDGHASNGLPVMKQDEDSPYLAPGVTEHDEPKWIEATEDGWR